MDCEPIGIKLANYVDDDDDLERARRVCPRGTVERVQARAQQYVHAHGLEGRVVRDSGGVWMPRPPKPPAQPPGGGGG